MAVYPRLLHEDLQTGQVRPPGAVPSEQQTISVPSTDVVPAEGTTEQVSILS